MPQKFHKINQARTTNIKGEFRDPVGEHKRRKPDWFIKKEYKNRVEYILRAKNIPSTGNLIIGSDQEYRIAVKESGDPIMKYNVTVSGTNQLNNEYFEMGIKDGEFKILKGNPPPGLSINVSPENLTIIKKFLDIHP